jgi:hypothetical protein
MVRRLEELQRAIGSCLAALRGGKGPSSVDSTADSAAESAHD